MTLINLLTASDLAVLLLILSGSFVLLTANWSGCTVAGMEKNNALIACDKLLMDNVMAIWLYSPIHE